MSGLAQTTMCQANGYSIGLGYPYASLKYDFGGGALEGRYISDSAVQAYAGRTYLDLFRSDTFVGFTGLEGGYLKFNALGARGTGVEGAAFLGGEIFVSESLSLLMDFAPTIIKLKADQMSANSVEYVANLALYIHFGKSSGAIKHTKSSQKVPEELSEDDFSSSEGYRLYIKLRSSDPVERRQAAYELGKLKEKNAAGALLDLLNDENEQVVGVAALSLGWMGDKRSVSPLIYKLSDKSIFVRAAAAKALGYLGDWEAEKPLEKLLDDESPQVRKVAEESLGIVRRSKKMKEAFGDMP